MRKCQHVTVVFICLLLGYAGFLQYEHHQATRALEHANEAASIAAASSAYWKDQYYESAKRNIDLDRVARDLVRDNNKMLADLTSTMHKIEVHNQEREKLKEHQKALKSAQTTLASVSAYNPTKEQNGPNPFITAKGTRVRHGIVAVSRDLYRKGWTFGKKVRIGSDIYVIEDLMAPRMKNGVDIFMWNIADAETFGRQQLQVTLVSDS